MKGFSIFPQVKTPVHTLENTGKYHATIIHAINSHTLNQIHGPALVQILVAIIIATYWLEQIEVLCFGLARAKFTSQSQDQE